MLTLYSYPDLFGVADNNPYGLKTYAFLKLCQLPFEHQHIIDTKDAPRGQLPFLKDGEEVIGDSDTIIAHLISRYGLAIDEALTPYQRDTSLMIRRTLDDLYWVMSASRWKDERYWPLFRDALLRTHANLTPPLLEAAQAYNAKRYFFQGIGRYEPEAAYARGVADLAVLANLLPETGYFSGEKPTSIDAGIYGFIANIYFYEIETPLKSFVLSKPNLIAHCAATHKMVTAA